jgi:hypothetical protein
MPSASAFRHPAGEVGKAVDRHTGDHSGLVKIGRAGWFAKGVVYLLAGYLALRVAAMASGWSGTPTATGEQEASPTGAIKTVADSAAGTLLLWVLALGMLLYAAWRVISAVLPGGKGAESMAHRIGYLVSAIVYTTFAISAIALARDAGATPDGNATVTDISASVMSHTAGRLVIGLVGVIVMAVGVYRVYKGATMDVNDELDLSGLSATRVRWTERLGAIGEVGRGVGIGLVGFFLLRSAMTYDAAQATGLDGALRRIAVESWGVVVVIVVGVGFAAYGIFCLATFTHRRFEAP